MASLTAAQAEHDYGTGSRTLPARVDWVDFAKGVCIVFVVMMHSTLGVEKAAGTEGWMHAIVQFAKPFRMPDFFLISGLFLGLVIDRPWRRYLDRKVIHFAYFYLLWMTIQLAVKAPQWLGEGQSAGDIAYLWLFSLVQPFGTLWFIYLLPVFFVVTRAARNVPWQVMLGVAALLEIAPVHSGWMIVDEFAARYVYFLAGYLFATRIFAIAQWAQNRPVLSAVFLALWFAVNLWATFLPVPADWLSIMGRDGNAVFISDLPLVSLALGAAGALAIILTTALVSQVRWARFLAYIGRHSIVVYLAFFFPMAVARIMLLKLAPGLDIGTVSLIVTACGVAGPLVLHRLIGLTGLGRFLFERPAWASIDIKAKPSDADASSRAARLTPAQ